MHTSNLTVPPVYNLGTGGTVTTEWQLYCWQVSSRQYEQKLKNPIMDYITIGMPYQCNLCYWLCQRCIAELALSSRGIDFPWQQAKWWIDWHLFSTILVLLTTQCTFTKQATFIHLFIQFSMHIAVCIIYQTFTCSYLPSHRCPSCS